MAKYHNDFETHNIASGNSLDLEVNYCESEIRADVVVSEYNSVRLWGRVVNCEGKPVSNALVKLLRIEYDGNRCYYTGIAHTVSDCEGFYQFELYGESHDRCASYKVLVNKAVYGPERVIPTSKNNCTPCTPCNPHKTNDTCASYDSCEQCEHYKFGSCKEYQQTPSTTPKQDVPSYGVYEEDDYMWGCGTRNYIKNSRV